MTCLKRAFHNASVLAGRKLWGALYFTEYLSIPQAICRASGEVVAPILLAVGVRLGIEAGERTHRLLAPAGEGGAISKVTKHQEVQ